MKRPAKAQFVTVSLMILTAFIVLPVPVQAVDYIPGVKVGDWIKYGSSVTWTGNGTEPSSITEEKKIDWLKMEVVNVSGTLVYVNTTLHYNNGTQIPQNTTVDVSGSSQYSSGFFLIAANLKSGDAITTQANLVKINQTITRPYVLASRNVNVVNVTTVYQGQTSTTTIYFDQSTGFMVEIYSKSPDYNNPGAYAELSIKATETNMWNADFVQTLYNYVFYIIGGVAVVLLIFILAASISLRRRKPSQQPPPPSTASPPPSS
ncbi:MAG TPA: hypothetical protein VMT42_06600 [candidate division Zixibacteria bacterium]|nr:hypothetical protein [candidate division Zixibacteria bacterium]